MSTTSSTSTRPVPRPLRLTSANSNSNSSGKSGLPTPLSASALGPFSAPLHLGRNGMDFDTAKAMSSSSSSSRPNPRRQSSISYNTGAASSQARMPGSWLGRSNSVDSKVVMDSVKHSSAGRSDENRSPGSRPISANGVRETEAVTLAEKHADLLRFIAQKESKCLELRTQLAQHEADLLLLKRKWERIVSKSSPESASTSTTSGGGAGDMLDGIREGVQSGLERVFSVLEPASSTSQPHPTPKPGRSFQQQQHAVASTNKRVSTSTASSSSTRNRSSLSGSTSASSASSLFDDLAALDSRPQSSASSIGGDSTACPSPDTEKDRASSVSRPSKAFKRNSSSFAQLPSEGDASVEAESHTDEDPSSKKRRSRPSSMNLSQVSSPLAPTSYSPGSTTPLGKQMSTWVPGLNKRWEELKGNETITKQSKRASVLLNDVLAALVPPVSAPGKHRLTHSPSHSTLDSAFFDPVTAASIGPGSASASGRKSPSPTPTPTCKSPSLLDEDDEFRVGDVLTPEVKAGVPKAMDNVKKDDDDADEWNW